VVWPHGQRSDSLLQLRLTGTAANASHPQHIVVLAFFLIAWVGLSWPLRSGGGMSFHQMRVDRNSQAVRRAPALPHF
jgi:hypothetical protein